MIGILDISGLIYRAFYGTPSMNYNGQEVGALFGFCSEIINILKVFNGAKFVAALDSAKQTFRNDIYPQYKANRRSMPVELVQQCNLIQCACEKFGFKIAKCLGYEADDIIASYTKHFCNTTPITIVSCDKDLLQLLHFDNVKIYNPLKRRYVDTVDVMHKFGVTPAQLLDMFSLMGDASDNIPGIPGVGIKIATKLINQYKSLDGLINNLEKLPNTKLMQKVKENISQARLSKQLVKLCDDLELDFDLQSNTKHDIRSYFELLGFNSLLKRLQALGY